MPTLPTQFRPPWFSYTKLFFFVENFTLNKSHTNWKYKYLRILWTKAMNIYQFYEWRVLNNRIVDILKIPSGAPFSIDTVSPDEASWAPRCPPLACPRADPLLMLPRLTQFHSNKHSIAWSETTAATHNAGLKIWNSTKIIFFFQNSLALSAFLD